MEIKFDLELDDIVALTEYHLSKSEYAARSFRGTHLLSSLIFLMPGVLFFLTYGKLFDLIAFSVLAVLIYVAYPKLEKRRRYKSYAARGTERRYPDLESSHVLMIEGDTLIEETEHGEFRLKHSGIVGVESTDNHTFIFTAPNAAIIIPKDRVVYGNYDAFVKALKEELIKKNSN